MDLATLIPTLWPIDPPHQVEPLGGGINNKSFRIETRSGAYILRLYPTSAPPAKIAYETQVLAQLADADLPFGIPTPIRSRSGEITPDVLGTRAVLVPVIPGVVRQPESPAQATAVGEALGALSKAMGRLTPPQSTVSNYGNLESINPLLPDPIAAADLPIIDPAQRGRVAHLLEAIMTERDLWYRTLPQQVIHADCVPFNILMEGDRVTAVLDFELACFDLRALDFVIGFWPWLRWNDTNDWVTADAFSHSYRRNQALTPSEAEALPFLLRLRKAGGIIWWAGKYLQGAADEARVQWVIDSALQLEDWLTVNQSDLLAHASRWVRC